MIERTENIELIKSIFTHPDNYPFLSDDGSVPVENFEPIMGDKIYYLVLGDNDGIVLLYPTNSVSLDAHICMTTDCRGKKAIKYGKEAIKWVFDNTDYHKINTKIPSYNMKVFHYATSLGFEYEGIDEKSFMKDGYLYNQHIMGYKRMKSCHQQQQ